MNITRIVAYPVIAKLSDVSYREIGCERQGLMAKLGLW
jgi:hypothetical protein